MSLQTCSGTGLLEFLGIFGITLGAERGRILGYRLLEHLSFSGFDDILKCKRETAVVTQLIISSRVHLIAFSTL
jgi:hypothetical protein